MRIFHYCERNFFLLSCAPRMRFVGRGNGCWEGVGVGGGKGKMGGNGRERVSEQLQGQKKSLPPRKSEKNGIHSTPQFKFSGLCLTRSFCFILSCRRILPGRTRPFVAHQVKYGNRSEILETRNSSGGGISMFPFLDFLKAVDPYLSHISLVLDCRLAAFSLRIRQNHSLLDQMGKERNFLS